MKKLLSIILITVIIFISISCSKEEMNPEQENIVDLSGEWLGEGYDCPWGVQHNERISIEHNLETSEVVATKITGDDCVTAGNITFTGDFNGKINLEQPEARFDVQFITGEPSNPNSSTATSTLEVVNNNLLRDIGGFEGIIFTRDCDLYKVDERVDLVPLIAQPTGWSCWATCAAMMLSYKNNITYSVKGAMNFIGNEHYITRFDDDNGLPINESEDFFINTLGLTGIPISYSISGLIDLLKNKGPLLILTDDDLSTNTAFHARIITRIHGDESLECTYVVSNDPWGGRVSYESFENFNKRYQGHTSNIKLYYFD